MTRDGEDGNKAWERVKKRKEAAAKKAAPKPDAADKMMAANAPAGKATNNFSPMRAAKRRYQKSKASGMPASTTPSKSYY